MKERETLAAPKLAMEGCSPFLFNKENTGVESRKARKAVNEGTELAFDLEEKGNIDFQKQAYKCESREKLSARLKRNDTKNQIN